MHGEFLKYFKGKFFKKKINMEKYKAEGLSEHLYTHLINHRNKEILHTLPSYSPEKSF